MKRYLQILGVVASTAILLVGCGEPEPKTLPTPTTPAPQHLTAKPVGCMGPCLPTLKVGVPPKVGAGLPRIPDVSEWQPCVNRAVPTVFRLAYGSRQDFRAACDGKFLSTHHVWRGAYTYLLPGSCTVQANAAARIERSVGGVNLVVADGEEPLGSGFIRCFESTVHRQTGLPTATYTGCYSGLERIQPLWVPSYGARPVCGPFKAWQFSDGSFCGEPYVTDCSFDYGITAEPKPKPNRSALLARQRTLRRVLLHYGCRRRVRQHEQLGPKCIRWFREGREVDAKLG